MEEPRGNVFDLWYEAYTNGSHIAGDITNIN
jgi:hypothetical protein